MFHLTLKDSAYISFVENTFNNIDVNAPCPTKNGCFLEFRNNIFNNRLVSIHASSAFTMSNEECMKYYVFNVKEEAVYRWKQIKLLEQVINNKGFEDLEALKKRVEDGNKISLNDIAIMLLNIHNWVRVESGDMTHNEPILQGSACVVLDSNKFKRLIVQINGCCWFRGRNKIEFLEMCEISPYWHFGPYQEIDPQGNRVEAHKDTFLSLYKKAIDRNDQSQARILQLEIKKCEHHILLREKRSWANIQDLVIYSWGYWVSRHSTSWAMPILWLALVNALFTGLLYFVCMDNFDLQKIGIIFVEFFNPVSSPAKFLLTDVETTTFLSTVNIIQKILLGVLIYEIIKAFRRFSLKM